MTLFLVIEEEMLEQAEIFIAVADICILIILAELASTLNDRLRLPRILGTIFTGILFGPYLIGGVEIGGRAFIEYNELIYVFAEFGAVLLLFEAGLHMKFSELLNTGKASFTVAAVGVVVPFGLGYFASTYLGYSVYVGLIVGGALSATSIAISLACLGEMAQLGSPEAKLIIGAAVIDDVLALSIASVILSMLAHAEPQSIFTILRLLITTVGLWFVLSAVSSRVIPNLMEWIMRLEGLDKVDQSLVSIFALLSCFGYASLAGLLGLSPLVGAFMAGMAVAGSKHHNAVQRFTNNLGILFIPLFFVVIGTQVNPYSVLHGNFLLMAILGVVAVVSKLVACGLPAQYFLGDKERGIRVGFGMISRGEIGLVISSMGITYGIISDEVYTALVVVIFITTLLPPFLLRRSYLSDPSCVLPDNIRDKK